jgi:hypothetical protein
MEKKNKSKYDDLSDGEKYRIQRDKSKEWIKAHPERISEYRKYVKCELCDANVLNINNHNKTDKHLLKLNKEPLRRKKLLCGTCDIPIVNMTNHVKTYKHLSNQKKNQTDRKEIIVFD